MSVFATMLLWLCNMLQVGGFCACSMQVVVFSGHLLDNPLQGCTILPCSSSCTFVLLSAALLLSGNIAHSLD